MGDLAVCLNEITGVNGSLELNVVVRAEQALVSVTLDQQLGGHVAEQMDHVGAIHQIPAVVSVLGRHAQPDHRGILLLVHFDSTPQFYVVNKHKNGNR